MKDKLFELLGGLPFFLMTIDGKNVPNKTRLVETVIIAVLVAVLTTFAISMIALPLAVSEIKLKLAYTEVATSELKAQVLKMCDKQDAINAKVISIDALQQERLERERLKGR